MKQSTILIIVYVIVVLCVLLFLWKFTNRGYSRRVLSDIGKCPFGKEKYFVYSEVNERFDAEGFICFSLYGNYTKYAPTLYGQLDDIQVAMPTWQSRIYVPIDCPDSVVNEMTTRGAMVIKMNGGEDEASATAPGAPQVGIKGHEGALWRFLGATQSKPFITLDADDSFDKGMPQKIENWLNSGRIYFIFKPIEILLPMAAGRWGARGVQLKTDNGDGTYSLSDEVYAPIPDMLERMNEYCEHWFGFDEAFLKKEIWPIVRKSVYRAAYLPLNEIIIFSLIAAVIAGIISVKTSKTHDAELRLCRTKL